MISEIRKSINAILFERVTSPFYGAFLVAWCIWNWRIIYLTVFVSEEKVSPNKLLFIQENYINFCDILFLPLGYAVLLLTLGQLISNGAYWLWLLMRKWKISKRNEIEAKQLLTIEQSIELRLEIQRLQADFERMVRAKDEQIELLERQVHDLKSQANSYSHNPYSSGGAGDIEFRDFQKAEKAYQTFSRIADSLLEKKKLPEDLDPEVKRYYIINDIIQEISGNPGYFHLTFKGGHFHKLMFNEGFATKITL